MDWSPKLQRQSSCTCTPLDVASIWRSNSSRRRSSAAGFHRRFDFIDDGYDNLSYAGKISRWRGFWRKIAKEKRRILNSTSPVQLKYDPYSYAQNFDDGEAAAMEPDNLSRSFSARFAAPSRMLQRIR